MCKAGYTLVINDIQIGRWNKVYIETKALTPDLAEDYIDFLSIGLSRMVRLIIRATATPSTWAQLKLKICTWRQSAMAEVLKGGKSHFEYRLFKW